MGGAGDDRLYASSAYRVDGGSGIDTVSFDSYAALTVRLDVTKGQDTGDGRKILTGVENVIGGRYGDTIGGNAGNNLLSGEDGNDLLTGQAGNDTLLGGSGSDTLLGGAGNDVLDGGEDGFLRLGELPHSRGRDRRSRPGDRPLHGLRHRQHHRRRRHRHRVGRGPDPGR
ncbi:hypothetical protein EYE35_21675 (plasmid) [Cereibacter sphaeroides]|nr:hypothetical protein EYE35_21675 [Cereibacter sphaeroides]